MKSVVTTITLLILTTFSSRGMINLEWEIDLTQYDVIPIDDFDVKVYSDDSIVVRADAIPHDQLLLFGGDGNLRFQDSLSAFDSIYGIGGYSSNPNFIFIHGASLNPYTPFTRIYQVDGNTFSATNILGESSSQYRDSIAGGDPFVLVTVEGNYLKKYTLSPKPSVVSGSVVSGISGSNYVIKWDSKAGVTYQIQTSSNMTNWVDIGGTISGTGTPLSWANALINTASFYRVIEY